jgi:hypothetical protein
MRVVAIVDDRVQQWDQNGHSTLNQKERFDSKAGALAECTDK